MGPRMYVAFTGGTGWPCWGLCLLTAAASAQQVLRVLTWLATLTPTWFRF